MKTVICGRWNKHSSLHAETRALWSLRNKIDAGKATLSELKEAENSVTAMLIRELEARGVSIVGDGCIRWDSIFDVAMEINGCKDFLQLTRIPKTNHFHRQPKVYWRWEGSWEKPLLKDDLEFAKKQTDKPLVMCLPGPYSLARQTEDASECGLERVAEFYAQVLNKEILFLLENGTAIVRVEDSQILDHPEDFPMFKKICGILLRNADTARVALATWLGDIRQFPDYFELPFGMFFVDFVRQSNLDVLSKFPKDKILVAGVIEAQHTYDWPDEVLFDAMDKITAQVPETNIVVSTNTDLHFLPWDKSLAKVERLVDFAKRYEGRSRNYSSPAIRAPRLSPAKTVVVPENISRIRGKNICRISFPTSAVGSYPQFDVRPLRTKLKKGEITESEYCHAVNEHTAHWMKFQEEIDLTIPVSGELLREDMAVYFGEKLGGTLLDFVPSYENRRYRPMEYAQNISPLSESMILPNFQFVQSLTKKPIKETITGPATLAAWALIKNEGYYRDRRKFRKDLALAMRREIKRLITGGVKIIQVDEPALTTEMECFSMDWEAIHETVQGLESKAYLVLHICYSDMEALDTAFPHILELPFHQIHMEMANRNYAPLKLIEKYGLGGKDIGFGVINVHTDRIETVEEIVRGVDRLLALNCFSGPEQIWFLPDCGLKERSEKVAMEKLRVMCEAAEICRKKFS